MVQYINNQISNYFFYVLLTFLTILSPLISIVINLFLFFSNQKRIKKMYLAMLLSFSFGYIAYHTVPLESDDLYRHYQIMENLSHVGITEIFNFGYLGVPLNTLIMYMFAVIRCPHMYPAFYVGFGVFLIMDILKCFPLDSINTSRFKRFFINFIFFLFILLEIFPRYYISGLRNHFAFIVLAYTIIFYYINNSNTKFRKLRLFLSFFCCLFIHSGSILIITFFLFYNFIYKRLHGKIKILITLLLLCLFPILNLFAKIIGTFFPKFLSNVIINKFVIYSSELINITNFNHYTLLIVLLIFNFVILLIVKRKANNNLFFLYNDFYSAFFLFYLAFIPNMTYLMRLTYIISILSIPIFHQFFSIIKKNNLFIFVISVIIFLNIILLLFNYRSIIAYPWYLDIHYLEFFFPILTII